MAQTLMTQNRKNNPHPMSLPSVWVGVVASISAGLILAQGVTTWYRHAMREAKDEYRLESRAAAERVQTDVENTFRSIYQGLRTIARLPGIRNLDSYDAVLTENSRVVVQEIYNNLASNVQLSEVYIIPIEFDPDQTGSIRSSPLYSFDELIVGRHAATGPNKNDEDLEIEEIEIHEYRLITRQLAQIRKQYARSDSFTGLEHPAICGTEVLTCDNTRFDPVSSDDTRRSGLVYSVPYYGLDGSLQGCISAIFLTDVLRDILPTHEYVIRAREHQYFATPYEDGVWQKYPEDIEAIKPAEDLLYSNVISLNIRDMGSEWAIWNGRLNSAFALRDDVVSSRLFATSGGLSVTLLTIGMTLFWILLRRNTALLTIRSDELERLVGERTVELEGACSRAETATNAKSMFLANMSHEIRTPMTAILGFADVLADSDQSVEERKEMAHTIQRNGEHLLAIINDILDLSKIEAGKMTVEKLDFSPERIVEEVGSMMRVRAAAKGLNLKVKCDRPFPAVIKTDPVRLRQILINLVGNAIKFTSHGQVILHAGVQDTDDGNLALRFDVIDTGVGMSQEQAKVLFDPFVQADISTTRRFGGTGLGLAISSRFATMLDGKLAVQSNPGRGSTFSLLLNLGPRSSVELSGLPEAAQPATASTTDNQPLSGRILLVEDGPDNQRLFSHLLTKSGADVEISGDGKQGLDKALNAAETGDPFDLILMDMQMPVMDGYEATKTLRDRGYNGPIVALTAHAMTGDRVKCLAAGCDEHLTKPVDRAELISACLLWMRPHDSDQDTRKVA